MAAITTTLAIKGDSGTDSVTVGGEQLIFKGDTGITTSVGANTVTIDLDDTSVTAGLYGGMLLLLFYVLIEVGCIYSIIIASERSQQKIYSGVVKSYFGERFGFIFAIVIAVYFFFTCAGGFIIVKNVISPILLHRK